MKNITQIVNGLRKGNFTALDKISNAKWIAALGKNADGTTADFEVAKISGGKYGIKVLEAAFLNAIQNFGVKNGLTELGADFVNLLGAANFTAADFAELFPSVKTELFNKSARNYIRALNLAKITQVDSAALTDAVCFELIQTVCQQKAALGLTFERPNEVQKAEVLKGIDERSAAKAKAAADLLAASLKGKKPSRAAKAAAAAA